MIKILINTNLQQPTGLSFHRLIVPYTKVSDLVEFKCDVFEDCTKLTDEQLKEYQAVVYQREIKLDGTSKEIIERYQKNGLKVIFDIDDYWKLPPTHYLSNAYKDNKVLDQTIEIIKLVDVVTTTTEHLANEIRQYNKNVYVLPNCLDLEQEQWQPKKIQSDSIRFGYIAGVHHVEDVRLMDKGITKAIFSNLNCSFVLGGYSDNAHYRYYESVMSCNGVAKDKYTRLNAMSVTNYGMAYNAVDISLVPLTKSVFTPFKSEIKLLEAAAHNNTAIVSDVLPYNIFPKDAAVWVKDESDWYKAIRLLSNNKAMREDKALELSGYVKLNYDLNKWTKIRKEILRLELA